MNKVTIDRELLERVAGMADRSCIRAMDELRATLAAPAPAGWVPVTERMPEISGLVLVYRPTAHELPANDANVTIKPYSTTLGFGGCHKVTHWMTLPAAPSAEGEV